LSVDFYIKVRDGAQLIADAANEQLEREAPPEVKLTKEDVDKLSWTDKEGTKANYQQTTKDANNNSEVFQALQKILSDRKGFWQSFGYKWWFHQKNQGIIDRRKK